MYDKYTNRYNARDDAIHKKVKFDQFLRVKMTVVLDEGGELDIPVSLDSHDAYNGYFRYRYELTKPYKGYTVIDIKCLGSEAIFEEQRALGKTEEELSQIDYPDEAWVHITDSPFYLRASERDASLFDSTKEDLRSLGLAMTRNSIVALLPET
jgi:hypothetical protein